MSIFLPNFGPTLLQLRRPAIDTYLSREEVVGDLPSRIHCRGPRVTRCFAEMHNPIEGQFVMGRKGNSATQLPSVSLSRSSIAVGRVATMDKHVCFN